MTKTTEDIYEDRLKDFTRQFVNELVDDGLVGYLDVVEFLEENSAYEEDIARDVYNAVDSVLNDLLDRWLSEN